MRYQIIWKSTTLSVCNGRLAFTSVPELFITFETVTAVTEALNFIELAQLSECKIMPGSYTLNEWPPVQSETGVLYLETVPDDWYQICATRTDKPPCRGAKLYEIRQRDRRLATQVENTNWFEFGANHKQIGEFWYRDIGTEYAWFLEIRNFPAFVREHGECYLTQSFLGHMILRIDTDD